MVALALLISCQGSGVGTTATGTAPAPAPTLAATPSPKPLWRPTTTPQGAAQGTTWIAVDSFDGAVLIANVIPSGRPGPSPIAINLHGDGGLRMSNLDLAAWLAKEGYISVTPCWQGSTDADAQPSGRSTQIGCSTDAPKRASAADVTKDLNAIVDAARTLSGARGDRVVVVGHSAGATAAVLFGSLGGRIDRVVSISGVFGTGSDRGPGSFFKARWGTIPAEQADSLAVPLLIVHGTNDQLASPDAARAYEKALRDKGKAVESLYVEGAPHQLPFLATYWTDEVRGKVLSFLAK
jgi:dienelactone hydrolase